MLKPVVTLAFVSSLLMNSLSASAQSFGQLLSGAGQVAAGQQQAENAAMQNRMLELQVQQANRDAMLRELEYQQKMQQLRLMQEQQRLQALQLEKQRRALGVQ